MKRQSWRHPQVRFWWVLAAVLLLGVGYLAYEQLALWAQENRLIANGTVVNGTIRQIGEMTLPNHAFPPDSVAIIAYEFKGEKHTVTGKLGGRKTFINTGEVVPLRVDPNDPDVWTARQEPGIAWATLLPPLLALPTVLIALIACAVVRARILRTWQMGESLLVRVAATQTSPLAPAIPTAKCVRADDADDRVMTVYVPRRVNPGDLIWVVAPPSSPNRALPVAWFAH